MQCHKLAGVAFTNVTIYSKNVAIMMAYMHPHVHCGTRRRKLMSVARALWSQQPLFSLRNTEHNTECCSSATRLAVVV